ncbi:hypothetical protein GOHSU_19_00650 [Gordonia hirsuta DSM 44140 = NBRC 16056]|uniref:Porin MspA n=1 Tax=Gordonia hirsuta DSM 44140 = NBRC 16056 TaxID=1121927 RepID=L7L8L6_9ACTN|nr:MspA family porin [Gordonia hirsuta]GAC57460.1 hypothetical protein GOHSU_19_00650 [Gordonia hirsuta DSM 44140 = NBRC 16056]
MNKLNKRVVTGVAVTGAALLAVTGVGAGMAEAKNLPGAVKTRSFDEGKVQIRLFDEKAVIKNSVANNHFDREVWVSGKIRVTTSGGVKGGNINAGYLVGCQMNFGAEGSGGGSGGIQKPGNGGFDQDFGGGGSAEGFLGTSANIGGGFKLAPGQAGYFPVINASASGNPVNSFNFGNARGGVAYSQERFGVGSCAGYAQAMAKVTVKVATDTFKGNITMYGKPFSIG